MCRTENKGRLGAHSVLCFFSCVFIALSVLHFGCGSDPDEEQTAMPEESLQSGWAEYRSGNYGTAILAFEKALADGDGDGDGDGVSTTVVADAYNGLGWVYLGFSQNTGVNLKNIATALSKFQEAIAHDADNADAWVGQAGSLLARRGSQNDLKDALKAIDNALQGDTEYLYRHDYDSEADLRALKLQCYYYLGEWGKARDEISRVLAIEENNSVALTIKKLL